MNIPAASAIAGGLSSISSKPASSGSTSGFAEAIGAAINDVESSKAVAKQAATDLLAGNRGDVHNVALVSQRAELSLELFQQVRNKFVQAYQEVMRMPM